MSVGLGYHPCFYAFYLRIRMIPITCKITKLQIFPYTSFISFYNLHTQVYVLAKFQPKTCEVTALQSSSNRKINLYSKYRENTLQLLTKTDVTYKWSDVQT